MQVTGLAGDLEDLRGVRKAEVPMVMALRVRTSRRRGRGHGCDLQSLVEWSDIRWLGVL
jgi:hypothetical protein